LETDARTAEEASGKLQGLNRELEAKLATANKNKTDLEKEVAELKANLQSEATAVSRVPVQSPASAARTSTPTPATTPTPHATPSAASVASPAPPTPTSTPPQALAPAAPTATPIPVSTVALPPANAVAAPAKAAARKYISPAVRQRMQEAAAKMASNSADPDAVSTGGGVRSLAEMASSFVDTRDDKTKEVESLELLFGILPPSKKAEFTAHEALSAGVVRVGVGSEQGIRRSMEDREVVVKDMHEALGLSVGPNEVRVSVCSVFDGHGGARVSEFAAANLHKYAGANPGYFANETLLADGTVAQWPEGVMRATDAAIAQLDSEFMSIALAEDPVMPDGSCALTMALKYELGKGIDSRPTALAVGNLGDSRAVLSRAGRAIDLSSDHTPRDADERERIEAAGG
jgi:hypothetical protein